MGDAPFVQAGGMPHDVLIVFQQYSRGQVRQGGEKVEQGMMKAMDAVLIQALQSFIPQVQSQIFKPTNAKERKQPLIQGQFV